MFIFEREQWLLRIPVPFRASRSNIFDSVDGRVCRKAIARNLQFKLGVSVTLLCFQERQK